MRSVCVDAPNFGPKVISVLVYGIADLPTPPPLSENVLL